MCHATIIFNHGHCVSGKFSRVLLCRHESRGHYHALKLMVLEDIIRHKQVTTITVMTIVIIIIMLIIVTVSRIYANQTAR